MDLQLKVNHPKCYSEKSHGEQELVACGRDLSPDKGDRKVGQSAGWGMLFSAVAADPMLGKHGRRGEGRRVEHWVPEWMFSLPVPTPFFFFYFLRGV